MGFTVAYLQSGLKAKASQYADLLCVLTSLSSGLAGRVHMLHANLQQGLAGKDLAADIRGDCDVCGEPSRKFVLCVWPLGRHRYG
jgi:hypothetical protein